MSRRRSHEPSRLGTLLLLVGLATILGGTFLAGMTVGRQWPGVLPMFGAAARRGADTPRGRDAQMRGADRAKPVEPAPVLTFYQELTAPLTSPPPARPKPERNAAPKTPPASTPPATSATAPNTTAGHYEPIITDPGPATPAAATDGAAGARSYTVQVGAFGNRPQADALRSTLAAAGFDAHVAEIAGPSSLRYRVRVGTFTSREAAKPTAQRLAERKLSTYVTTR